MPFCSNCGKEIPEEDRFCAYCGTKAEEPEQPAPEAKPEPEVRQQVQPPVLTPQPAPRPVDPTDHTDNFSKEDISENKVICMLPYLLGCIGIIIAMLGQSTSKYVAFHVRQVLKLVVVEALLGICAAVLCWTFIVPIAAAVCLVIVLVLRIMGFIYVCQGRAKEIPIVSSFGFLK